MFPYVANDRETATFIADALDKVKPFVPITESEPPESSVLAVTTRAQTKENALLDLNEVSEDEVLRRGAIGEESDSLAGDEEVEQLLSSEVPVEAEPRQDVGKGRVVEDCDVDDVDGVNSAEASVNDCWDDDISECTDDSVCVQLKDVRESLSEPDCRAAASLASLGALENGTDLEDFLSELKSDSSLATWRSLADNGERGFRWYNGRLAQDVVTDWEERGVVLAVPKSFRSKLLVIAHDKGGHLGAEKCIKSLRKCFTWPGLYKDVSNYCSSCERCQRKSKHVPSKAPFVEPLIVTEPFESVAVDIVGPLPKGRGGCRYLLTYICLASRWPEAVPLRSITAKSVASAMCEIFSRTGIPLKLLTDQGSQFMGKVVKSLCKWMGIQQVRTTPYHPESNGCVERMHGTLKACLGKCISDSKDWVDFVPWVLFMMRGMPHADLKASPSDLVYGRTIRTPLIALHHCLLNTGEDAPGVSACEWVSRLSEKLQFLRDEVTKNVIVAREKRKERKKDVKGVRVFEVGAKVMYRIPGRLNKLSDSWDGPFVVLQRVGEVNYRIAREGSRKNSKVVHVNVLKKFNELHVCRVDVVVEGDDHPKCVLLDEFEGYVKEDMDDLLSQFSDVFSSQPGNTSVTEISIDTGDRGPVVSAPYSVPLGIRDQVKDEIDSLVSAGIIERCESAWASPLVPVRKPDGSIRLCVDYRRVNFITMPEPYFIPSLDEMMELVGSGQVISKVDLAKGFHQVAVKEEDQDKTAFICPFGKFRYLRMPFGLRNAPSVFQRLMDTVLADCREFSRVYIDDVIVVSHDWISHLSDLKKLFSTLRAAGLTCKLSKCSFGRKHLEFLGHRIGSGSISVPEARVKAIRDHPRPVTRKQLRSFLGLIGFYRRFVKYFHKWSVLLTPHASRELSGVVPWSEEMGEAFIALCNSLSSSLLLCVPKCDDTFSLECDASACGIGSVLYVHRNDEKLPVAFFSRQLRGAQTRYSAQELEGLALVESIRHFAYYLYGRRFTVVTDHRVLVNLKEEKQLNRRLYRWSLILSEFDFEIVYRRGRDNVVADCLSRCYSLLENEGGGPTTPSKEGEM